jgi:hypothetical protein
MRKRSTFVFQKVIAACLLSWLVASAVCASTNPVITANSVNRDNKTDRSVTTQHAAHHSAPVKSTISSKHTPIGCEAAFSPFANPGRADLLNSCVT